MKLAERTEEPEAVRPVTEEAVVVVGAGEVVEGSGPELTAKGYWLKVREPVKAQQVWPERVEVAL